MSDSSGSARRAPKLAVERLEDRTVPTFLPRAGLPSLGPGPNGGLSIAVGNLFPDAAPAGFVSNEYVTGTGPGSLGIVRVFDANGNLLNFFVPFANYLGGINVAVGDVTGDAAPEIIVAAGGPGPPIVQVYTAGGGLLSSFFAFAPSFQGGVNIAVGNVLGGIAAGGFSGGTVSQGFKQEIIVGAAAGSTPHVVVTDAVGTVFRSFLAFDQAYKGGVTVAAASIDATRSAAFATTGSDTNAYDEIIVGAATAVPHVKAFEVWTGVITERLSFYAFDPSVQRGVTVAAGTTATSRGADIFVSQLVPANTANAPIIAVFSNTGQFRFGFNPFPAGYTRVVNMAVGYLKPGLYDPSDDNSQASGFNSFAFLTQDLTVVAGDGSFQQVPRLLAGITGSPAGANGP